MLNCFQTPVFPYFRDTLDSEMKRLGSTGEYTKKKAGVIGVQEEALLKKGSLVILILVFCWIH